MPQVRRALSNPREALRFVTRSTFHHLHLHLSGGYVEPADRTVLDRDWDVLVVLDACRYDALVSENPFDAECRRVRSQAPYTRRWFQRNFLESPESETSDLIYVTSNPLASSFVSDANPKRTVLNDPAAARRRELPFFHTEEVFEYGWDHEDGTVHPDVVTDRALQLHRAHPDQPMVVHYLQPHGPLVGTDRPRLSENNYEQLQDGKVDLETVKATYAGCLRYVLDDVERLVRNLSGDVAITADHGEGFGEYGIYGHPPWGYSRPLLDVPWITLRGGGAPLEAVDRERWRRRDDGGEEVSAGLEDKLESLGYL